MSLTVHDGDIVRICVRGLWFDVRPETFTVSPAPTEGVSQLARLLAAPGMLAEFSFQTTDGAMVAGELKAIDARVSVPARSSDERGCGVPSETRGETRRSRS